MKMKKIFLTSAVALALLSSCNNDHDGQDIAGTKLAVSASIDQVNTRLSDSGSEWTEGDAIGVSDNLSNPNLNIKYVAGSAMGDFTSTTGIYVLGNEEVTYTAYYPYAGNEGASAGELQFKIVDESGKYAGHNAVDFMYATGTATRSNPKVAFVFKHQMSKVSLNITDSNAPATKAETPVSYTLQGVIIDGTFNTGTGEITPGSTKGNVKVDAVLGTASSIILPPVAAGSAAEPIQLVIEVGDKIYAGSLTPALDASQEYKYSVDLSKTESGENLQIDSPTIDGWTPNDEGNIDVEEEVNYNPTLEVGDFLCKDGTTIDKDYDLAQLDEAVKASIISVVYYVGNPQPSVLYEYEDAVDALKRDYPLCTKGLAVAISNAQEAADRFATAKYNYSDWFKAEGNQVAESYIGSALNLTSVFDHILGYNNTRVMELAVADVNDNTLTGAENFMSILTQYRENNVVAGTSVWYLPSYAELKLMQDNYAVVSASMAKVGASLPQYTEFASANNEAFYWSSDLRGNSYNWVSPLADVPEGTNLYVGRTSGNLKGYFRFALAF